MEAYHPLYVTALVRVAEEFSVDLGVIELVPYLAVLDQKLIPATTTRSQPWPFSLLMRHLNDAYNEFALAYAPKDRKALAKYVDPLADIFERSVALLPTSLHDDNPSITTLRERLADYQRATDWHTPSDRTALATMVCAGDIRGARSLLDAGIDPNSWDSEGNSPLHIAAVENHTEFIELLLDAGAEIDRPRWGSGDTPLLEAVQHHSDAATLLLLERGADPTYSAWRGPALLSAVSQNARLSIVDALIAHGAITNATESRHIVEIFFAAARGRGKGPTLRRLVDAGIAVDVRDDNGQTALMLAAWVGQTESVTTLIDLGADQYAKDSMGLIAIDKAREKGHEKIVELLFANSN